MKLITLPFLNRKSPLASFTVAALVATSLCASASTAGASHPGSVPVSASSLGAASDAKPVSSITVANVAPAADRLVALWVVHRGESAGHQIVSVEGLGLTWRKMFHSDPGTSTRFALFSGSTPATAPAPGDVTVTFDAPSTRTAVLAIEIAGTDLTDEGATAITNLVSQENVVNTRSRTHHLQSFVDPAHNATLAFHMVGSNVPISVEDGMTRVAYVSNGSSLSSAAAFEAGEEVNPTFSWPKDGSNGGIALELRAAGSPRPPPIARRHLTQGTARSLATASTSEIRPSTGSLLVAFVANSAAPGALRAPVLSGPGASTWTERGTARFDSSGAPLKRVSVFVAESDTGGPVTISFGGQQDAIAWVVFEVTGADLTDGAAAAVRQTATASGDGVTTIGTSLRGFGSPSNATLAAVGFRADAFGTDGFAPEPGFALAMATHERLPLAAGNLRLWSEWRATPDPTPSGMLDVAHDAGIVAIEVKAAGVPQLPSVTSVAPRLGASAGGTAVTIIGTDLDGATAVRFGSVAATAFDVVSSSRIEATAPAQAPGDVAVTVTTPDGTSEDGPADDFRFAPTVGIADGSVGEGGHASLDVSLSEAAPFAVSVAYATVDDSARSGADYASASGTIRFEAGEVAHTISIPTSQDALDEPDETFAVQLSAGENALLADARGVVTIVDDDPAPALSIADASAAEGAGEMRFRVTLSAASGRVVRVGFSTADGTATAGADYTAVSGTAALEPGQTSTEIVVPILGDATDEVDETFVVNLSGASDATIADPQGQGRILDDDDGPPTMSISDPRIVEGNSGKTAMTFQVSLSSAITQNVTASYATADGTASAGRDYSGASGTVTIPAGRRNASILVPILGDTAAEPDETLFVNLSNPSGAAISDAQGQGTILNDDGTPPPPSQPSLTISDVSVGEGDGGATDAVFTVTASSSTTQNVTVSYETANGTAASGSDYTGGSGTATIPAGQTTVEIRVPVLGDAVDEPDETFFVNLSSPAGATITDGQGQGAILDDDPPTISISDVTVVEPDSKAVAAFVVSLSSPMSSDVTVGFATADGTATGGADYTAAAGTVTIPAGTRTTSVRIVLRADAVDEPDETFFVNLSSSSGPAISDPQGQGTILDND